MTGPRKVLFFFDGVAAELLPQGGNGLHGI
jgi:hypothetical protein